MGGWAPLGYDVKDRKLIANEPEAATVRMIFERFLKVGSATALARALADEGVITKINSLRFVARMHGPTPRPQSRRRSTSTICGFRYAIDGDNPPWPPVRAFDDGKKVYIEFPQGRSACSEPLLVGRDGAIGEEDEQMSPAAFDGVLELFAGGMGRRDAEQLIEAGVELVARLEKPFPPRARAIRPPAPVVRRHGLASFAASR